MSLTFALLSTSCQQACVKARLSDRFDHCLHRHPLGIVLHPGLAPDKADVSFINPFEPLQGPFDRVGSGKSGHPLDPEGDLPD